MQANPRKLRGVSEWGLALMLVVGTAGMMGVANVDIESERLESGFTAFKSSNFAATAGFREISEALAVGDRVAVFLDREMGSPMLLLDSVEVVGRSEVQVNLDVSNSEEELLDFARSLGDLRFVLIHQDAESPYLGEGVASVEELRKALHLNS